MSFGQLDSNQLQQNAGRNSLLSELAEMAVTQHHYFSVMIHILQVVALKKPL